MPVADKEDARKTSRATIPRLKDNVGEIIAVFVVEHSKGFMDKVPPEIMEEHANEILDIVEEECGKEGIDVRKEILNGTEVSDAIFELADEVDASSIVFIPRRGSRWSRILTGDVALDLITKTDIPVLILPKNNN